MSGAAVYGPIVTGNDVEQATISWLRYWLPSYLAELERRTGRTPGALELPFSWSTKNRFDRQPPEQVPAAIVVSPGLAGKPERGGDGTVAAWWRIGVAVVLRGVDAEDANEKAKLYGAAVRTIALQHPALKSGDHPDGFASAVELVDEGYDDVPADYLPIGAVAAVDLNVKVADIGDALAGPAVPDVAVPADWPVVGAIDDITVTIEKESLT